MKNAIKTTKELRDFLSSAMVDVRSGRLDVNKANAVAKIAGQINTSMYSELKVMLTMQKMEKKPSRYGDLEL